MRMLKGFGAALGLMILQVSGTGSAHAAEQGANASTGITLKDLDSGPMRPDAKSLATQILPRDMMLSVFETSLVNGLATGFGDDGAVLEKEFPGILEEVNREVLAAARPHMAPLYDKMHARYARLFTRVLTEAETADVARLFSTSAGRKILAQKYKAAASKETIQRLVNTETLKGSDIRQMNEEMVGDIVGSFSEQEKAELIAWAANGSFKKLQTLRPIMEGIDAEMGNESEPAMEKSVDEALNRVFKRHGITE